MMTATRDETFDDHSQPILISIPDIDKDLLFNNHKEDVCPVGKENSKLASNKNIKEAMNKGNELMDRYARELKDKLNLTDDIDFMMMKHIGDSLHSDYFHQPESSFLDINSDLGNYVTNINSVNHLSVYMDKKYIKVVVSNLLKEIFKFLADKIANPESDRKKLVYFSMHDTNISPILMYLGIIDFNCNLDQISTTARLPCTGKPPYASSIIFELVRQADSQHVIYFRYNGVYLDVCSGVMPPPASRLPCTLDRLTDRFADAVSDASDDGYCVTKMCDGYVDVSDGVEDGGVGNRGDGKGVGGKGVGDGKHKKAGGDGVIGEDRSGSGEQKTLIITHWDMSLLCVAIFVLSGMVFKYKSECNKRVRLLKRVVAQKEKESQNR